ncbi:hypothetical protein QCA50_014892 [Cerrena zonata]|uniref:Uncharacterized protein n=1 Tax=Cerrena zonata TaxID=2478898 RepID=A0AAW0FKH7_9APHY
MYDASQLEALREVLLQRYLTHGIATIFVYDLLHGIPDDVHILSSQFIKSPYIIYVSSRIIVTALAILALTSSAIPLDSCFQATMNLIASWLVAIVLPCNSWVFFLRVHAIHRNSRTAVITFTALWAAIFTSFTGPFSYVYTVTRQNDGSCITVFHFNRLLGGIPVVALIVFDTATIIGISLRITSYNPVQSWRERLKVLVHGNEMGRIQRLFLRSGQIYYLATNGVHILLFSMLLSSTVSTALLGALFLFSVVFQNIMACRVFRLLKLELTQDDPSFFTPVIFHNDEQSSLSVASPPSSYATEVESLT